MIYLLCQGKESYKIKITDDGVETVKNNGRTEKIPEVPGDGEDIETLEGVFLKSVGKRVKMKFHNKTGEIFLLSLMSMF